MTKRHVTRFIALFLSLNFFGQSLPTDAASQLEFDIDAIVMRERILEQSLRDQIQELEEANKETIQKMEMITTENRILRKERRTLILTVIVLGAGLTLETLNFLMKAN